MGPHKGYYSLIQFCPDRGRAEAVNIGLLLFVPDTGHLDIRTVRTTGRVARVFGRGAVDPWWLKTAREAFVRGMRTEHKAGRFAVASDLDKYLATLGNDIIPTPLRATRVDDTAADMARLFARLVELTPEPPKRDVPPVARPIDDVFTDLSMRMVRVASGDRSASRAWTTASSLTTTIATERPISSACFASVPADRDARSRRPSTSVARVSRWRTT